MAKSTDIPNEGAYSSSVTKILSLTADGVPKNLASSPVALIEAAQDLSTSFEDLGGEISNNGKKILYWLSVDIGSDTNVRLQAIGMHTTAGDEFPLSDADVIVHTDNTYTAAAASRYFELNDDADQLVCVEINTSVAIPIVKLKVSAGTHTDGTIATAYVTKGY